MIFNQTSWRLFLVILMEIVALQIVRGDECAINCFCNEPLENGKCNNISLPCRSVMTIECNQGYYMYLEDEKTNLTCHDNGVWTGRDGLVCKSVKCGPPRNITNGSYILLKQEYENETMDNEFTYGSQVASVCDPGYHLVKGSNMRVCQGNSSWGGEEPVCEKFECRFPVDVVVVDHPGVKGILFNETAYVTCMKHFRYWRHTTECICSRKGALMCEGLSPVCGKYYAAAIS